MATSSRPNIFRYWYGRYLLRMGYCPSCNSSPPRATCPVCWGERDYGPRLSDLDRIRWRSRWDALRDVLR